MPKPSVPTSEILDLLQQREGEISGFHKLTEGLASQAFGFRCGGDDYVIRINDSVETFQKDAFVSRRFAGPFLPIPETLEIGHLDAGPAFCVSRRAPGVRLHDLEAADRARIVVPVTQVMEAISASDLTGTVGFGRFDSEGVAPFATWKDFLLVIASPQYLVWEAVPNEADQQALREAVRRVIELSPFCPEDRCLIHGDFGAYNALADESGITAVLDWNLALFGDPLYETANLFFWHEEPLEPLLEHLNSQASELPHWRERMLCYQLRIGLQEIHDSTAWGNPVDIGWLTTRCKQLLDF